MAAAIRLLGSIGEVFATSFAALRWMRPKAIALSPCSSDAISFDGFAAATSMHRIILFQLLAVCCVVSQSLRTADAQFRFQRQPQYVPSYTPSRLAQPGFAQPSLAPGQRFVPGRPAVGQPPVAAPTQPRSNPKSTSQTGVLVPGFPPPVATIPAGSALSRMDFRNPSLELLRQLGAEKPTGMQDHAYEVYPRLSGEFEPQKAMLLSISDLMYQHYGVLKELITKTSGHLPLVILVNDKKQLKTAVLVNRNHKKYPVKADYKGISLSTSLKTHVHVAFQAKNDMVYLD